MDDSVEVDKPREARRAALFLFQGERVSSARSPPWTYGRDGPDVIETFLLVADAQVGGIVQIILIIEIIPLAASC